MCRLFQPTFSIETLIPAASGRQMAGAAAALRSGHKGPAGSAKEVDNPVRRDARSVLPRRAAAPRISNSPHPENVKT